MIENKKIAIFIEEMFNVFEFWYPYYRLKEEGAEVMVVGSGRLDVFTGKPATECRADVGAADVTAADIDGLVIPGGYAPDMMRRFPAMVDLVKAMHQENKLVAAICHAGWMLASADILQGKRVTSFYAIRDDLVHAGADWVDQDVVVDGNLITSRTPDDLPAFMKAIIYFLK